jgi:hypothetical protein
MGHPHKNWRTRDPDTFRHRAQSTVPRYSPVLVVVWVYALFMAILSFSRGITPSEFPAWNGHYVADGCSYLALLVMTSCLWSAWDREERHPELLPKREFDRRYPPSSGASPVTPRLRQVEPGVGDE